MSGENVSRLLQMEHSNLPDSVKTEGPYTGNYEKHMGEMSKPSYSTFFEKWKEYDGTHPRYFKQRDAIIGPSVNESVDPKNFLRAGGGVKFTVPPIHEKKMFTKAPLDRRGRKQKDDDDDPNAGFASSDGGKDKNSLRKPNGDDNGCNLNLHSGPFPESGWVYNLDGGAGNDSKGRHIGQGDAPSGNDDVNGLGDNNSNNNNNTMKNMKGDQLGSHDGGDDRDGGRLSGNADDMYGTGPLDGHKDFVRSNIIEMSHMVTKRRKDQPEYPTCRKSFGKPPTYLNRVNEEIQREKDYVKSLEDAQTQRAQQRMEKFVYRLDEAERLSLIATLKAKLADKSAILNKMPFAKDTFTQVKHRAELEAKIKEIESALAKLDKDAIFVYKDHPQCVQWAKSAALEEARRFASQSIA